MTNKTTNKTGYVAISRKGSPYAFYSENIGQLIYEIADYGDNLDEYKFYEVGDKVVLEARIENEE